MKIESIKEKLQKVIGQAERLTGKHLSLPILSCLLLIAKKGELTLRATNLDMGIECTLPVKVEKEGVVAVPAGLLSALIANLPNVKNVFLEEKDGKLLVGSSVSQSVITTSPSDDFPTIPRAEGEGVYIDPHSFVKGFKAVQYAGTVGNLKPELGSVYVYGEDKDLVFVATDSFRLAEKRIPLKKELAVSPLLIPIKNTSELVRLLEGETTEIKLYTAKGQLSFETPNFYVTSRLVEGNFPDYRQIMPKESSTEAVLLKEDLLGALKVNTLFSDRFNQIKVSVDPQKKKFELITRNGDIGESTVTIQSALTGASFEGNFNHRYISDCLGVIAGDSVVFRFSGEGRPLLIQGVGDTTFRYLVMPMNR